MRRCACGAGGTGIRVFWPRKRIRAHGLVETATAMANHNPTPCSGIAVNYRLLKTLSELCENFTMIFNSGTFSKMHAAAVTKSPTSGTERQDRQTIRASALHFSSRIYNQLLLNILAAQILVTMFTRILDRYGTRRIWGYRWGMENGKGLGEGISRRLSCRFNREANARALA